MYRLLLLYIGADRDVFHALQPWNVSLFRPKQKRKHYITTCALPEWHVEYSEFPRGYAHIPMRCIAPKSFGDPRELSPRKKQTSCGFIKSTSIKIKLILIEGKSSFRAKGAPVPVIKGRF